ncbi:MAG TPA: hypothetical protein VFO85_10210 [Vicinamibacteria bacterium]|nr:hypothetical protein [Vicinamibacteria bacterium]
MGLFRRLPTLWRLLREIDLESIRREADRPFQILVGAQDVADAEDLAARLSGKEARHPWVLAVEPEQALRRARSGVVDVAILRSPTVRLAPELAGARAALIAAGVPTITAIEVASGPMDLIAREGESTRVLLSAEGAEEALAGTIIAAVAPLARVSLARQLPPLRKAAFEALTEETARANAVYALTMGLAEVVPLLGAPLNLADIVVLTKNQLVMSYRLALAAGKQGNPRELTGEIVSVVGGGFLFRQVGRELVGLMPVIGLVPKVAVAYAGTLAIARAVVAWAHEGDRLGPDALKRAYKDAWRRGKALARSLVGRGGARRSHLRVVPPSPAQGGH